MRIGMFWCGTKVIRKAHCVFPQANGKSADMIERILEAMPEHEQCAVPPSPIAENDQGKLSH